VNYSQIVRPTRNLDGRYVLDVRIVPKTGRELALIITESVDHTQKFLVTEIPDILIVTQKQFASLQTYTEEMTTISDRMFITADGFVLEVTIDRYVDQVEIVEDAMQLLDDINEAEKEADSEQGTQER
jgi:chemotaxis signal transduction protein